MVQDRFSLKERAESSPAGAPGWAREWPEPWFRPERR